MSLDNAAKAIELKDTRDDGKPFFGLQQVCMRADTSFDAAREKGDDWVGLVHATRLLAYLKQVVAKVLHSRCIIKEEALDAALGDLKPIAGGAAEGKSWLDSLPQSLSDKGLDGLILHARETLLNISPGNLVKSTKALEEALDSHKDALTAMGVTDASSKHVAVEEVLKEAKLTKACANMILDVENTSLADKQLRAKFQAEVRVLRKAKIDEKTCLPPAMARKLSSVMLGK